jgi:hypothetical protein
MSVAKGKFMIYAREAIFLCCANSHLLEKRASFLHMFADCSDANKCRLFVYFSGVANAGGTVM